MGRRYKNAASLSLNDCYELQKLNEQRRKYMHLQRELNDRKSKRRHAKATKSIIMPPPVPQVGADDEHAEHQLLICDPPQFCASLPMYAAHDPSSVNDNLTYENYDDNHYKRAVGGSAVENAEQTFMTEYQTFCMKACLGLKKRRELHCLFRRVFDRILIPASTFAAQERHAMIAASKYQGDTKISYYCPSKTCTHSGNTIFCNNGDAVCPGSCAKRLSEKSCYGRVISVMPRSQLSKLLTNTNMFPMMLRCMQLPSAACQFPEQNPQQLLDNGNLYERVTKLRNFADKKHVIGVYLFSDEAYSLGRQQQVVGLYMGFRDLPRGYRNTFHIPLAFTVYHKTQTVTPDRAALFDIVINELNELRDFPIEFTHADEVYESRVIVTQYIGDAPEVLKCLGMVGNRGFYSCHVCMKKQPWGGNPFENVRTYRKKQQFLGPIFNAKRNGIKKKGSLLAITSFCPMTDVVTEPMHMIAGGLVKNILETALGTNTPRKHDKYKHGIVRGKVLSKLIRIHEFHSTPCTLVRKGKVQLAGSLFMKEMLSFFLTSFIIICGETREDLQHDRKAATAWRHFVQLCGTIHILTLLTFSYSARVHTDILQKLTQQFATDVITFYGGEYFNKFNYHRVQHLAGCIFNHGNAADWGSWQFELDFQSIRQSIRGYHQQLEAYRNSFPYLLHIDFASGNLIGARYGAALSMQGEIAASNLPTRLHDFLRQHLPSNNNLRYFKHVNVKGMQINSEYGTKEQKPQMFSMHVVDLQSNWYAVLAYVQCGLDEGSRCYAVAEHMEKINPRFRPWSPAPLPDFITDGVISQHYCKATRTRSLTLLDVLTIYAPAFVAVDEEDDQYSLLIACPFACIV